MESNLIQLSLRKFQELPSLEERFSVLITSQIASYTNKQQYKFILSNGTELHNEHDHGVGGYTFPNATYMWRFGFCADNPKCISDQMVDARVGSIMLYQNGQFKNGAYLASESSGQGIDDHGWYYAWGYIYYYGNLNGYKEWYANFKTNTHETGHGSTTDTQQHGWTSLVRYDVTAKWE